MNAWKDLKTGTNPPEQVNAIIEIPKGSRNKYEYSKEDGTLTLNRVLYSPLHFPGDYGLIPQTYYDDNDPLDILILINDPIFQEYDDISKIPQHHLKEIAHFFQVYKDLEGHSIEGLDWESNKVAKEKILYAMDLYKTKILGK